MAGELKMDVREKLVELLKTNACPSPFMCDPACRYYGFEDCFPERFADYLIDHGVTVQEWISVDDERKPKEGEDVLVAVFDGYDTYTDIDCLMCDGKWCFETENYKVTHWMEKPKPPKGE